MTLPDRRILPYLACWLIGSICAIPVAGQSSEPDQGVIHSLETQYLVLRTGGVYAGHLEFDGGQYVIRRDNGASVRFHQGEVDFVTDSMDNAYRKLHSRLEPDDVLGHHRLANWCLRHQQIDKARLQLEILRQYSRSAATIRLLERQIAGLSQPVEEPAAVQQQVAAETPPGIRQLPKTGLPMATRQDLQELLDSFSRESLREFNTSIHNRIVNGCAAARCHGDAGATMRLWRVDNRGGIQSTGVQRNLHAISRYIDRANPAASPLLRYTTEVHGGMSVPPYEATSHHFFAIRDWVMGTAVEMSIGDMEEPETVSQASYVDPPLPPALPPVLPETDRPPAPVDLMAEQTRFVPRDEFDPEIFNRRFGSSPRSQSVDQMLREQQPQRNRQSPSQTRSLPAVEDQ